MTARAEVTSPGTAPLRRRLVELDDIDRQLIMMIATYRGSRGIDVGPTWRELRRSFADGVFPPGRRGSDLLRNRLAKLRWARLVRYSDTPRSLDVTDEVREAVGHASRPSDERAGG